MINILQYIKVPFMSFRETLIGMLLFIAILQVVPYGVTAWNNSKPINDWFMVKQLQVSTPVVEGENPIIYYDRDIKKPFEATWIVEVQRLEEGRGEFAVCTGSNRNAYRPSDTLPVQIEFDWFIGQAKHCYLSPGKYRIFVQWTIDRGYYYDPYKLERLSNVFEVVEPPKNIQGQAG